jgi:hypothetical protein
MTNMSLVTRSACALGAAMLVTTALQSASAEARVHASGHTRASAHSVAHKVSSRVSQQLPGQHSQTGGGGGGGGGNETPQSKPGDGGRPVPPGGIPSGPRIPSSGGGKPTTGPINPGNLPGNKPTEQTPTPPVVTGSNPGPIPPVLNPGNIPGTKPTPGPKPVPPPETNNYPGGNRPPIITGTPTRVPVPPVIRGSMPPISIGNGISTTYGVYADVGAGYGPCQWFKSNYDRTGSVYWFNRYRVCLWQQ